ncbi:MAG: LysR family transcriptional regulator [Propionicimonas sp.]
MPNALSPVHLPALEDLLLLLAVEEHGGVGAAARELGMAQPNASRTLHRMERQLGLQLLKRTTTGSTLTTEGALVADWSRRVISAYSDLRAGVAAISGPQAGPVRVAASQTIAEELLPRWLASLRGEYPGIDVHLTVANSEQVGRALNDGGVLGFVESPQLPSTLQVPVRSRRVASDRLVVVVSPDHDWARRTRPVDLAELAATALVVREPGSGTRVSFEQAMDGFKLADPALELASNSAVRIAVAAGAAPAVLSELAVRHAVAAGDLRAVMVADFIVERPLQAVWARSPKPRPELLRLVELAALSETPE